MGQLRIVSDHLEGTFVIGKETVVAGRSADCQVALAHRSVSRHHCEITEQKDRLRVVDLESKYGTYVNGVRAFDDFVEYGDKLRIGRVIVVYEETDSASLSEEAPSPRFSRIEESADGGAGEMLKRPRFKQPPAPPPRHSGPRTQKTTEEEKWSLGKHLEAKKQQAAAAEIPDSEAFENPSVDCDPEAANQAESEARRREEERRRRLKQLAEGSARGDVAGPDSTAAVKSDGFWSRLCNGLTNQLKPKDANPAGTGNRWEEPVAGLSKPSNKANTTRGSRSDEDPQEVIVLEKGTGVGGIFSLLNSRLGFLFVLIGMAGLGLVGKMGFDRLTGSLLVPVPSLTARAEKARLSKTKGMTTGTELGDKVLGNAIETFQKTIPAELR